MSKRPSKTPMLGLAGVILAIVVIAGIVLTGLPNAVDAGEVCVITRGGKITGEVDSGYTFINVMEDANCMSTRPITFEAAVNPDASKAEYSAPAPKARSSDQAIDMAPYTIQFHIPSALPEYNMETFEVVTENVDGVEVPVIAREDNVSWVYANVGRSEQSVVRKILDAQNNIVPQVLQTYTSEDLFAGDLSLPQQDIFDRIFPVFYSQGVILDFVRLGKPDFNDEYEKAISDEQIAAQNVQIEKNRTLQAEEQANQQRVNAQAAADAEVIAAQGDAEANLTRDRAEAEGNQLVIDSYGGPENYANIVWAQSAANWTISTVLGDSGILPVFNVNSSSQEPIVGPVLDPESQQPATPAPETEPLG